MKFYEPFQRLSFLYFKGETTVYVKSSISVYLPGGVTLISKDTIFNPDFETTLKFYPNINNFSTAPYFFEQERSINFIKDANLADLIDLRSIKDYVGELLKTQLDYKRVCEVTCEIYDENGTKTGQVTNTIAQDGEVIIL